MASTFARGPERRLLRRVFAVEVSVCPVEGCGGRMRVVDIAVKPDDIARVLHDQPARSRAPPRPKLTPAQLHLPFS